MFNRWANHRDGDGPTFQRIQAYAVVQICWGSTYPRKSYLQVYSFTVSGEGLTSRLRFLTFKAMLRQEIGWFDEERNSTGSLTTRLADDASKVQGATGTRLGTLLETMVSMLAAVIIAFVYSWVLTLVILGVVPIILVASALEVKALSGHTVANKKSLEKAGKVTNVTEVGVYLLSREYLARTLA